MQRRPGRDRDLRLDAAVESHDGRGPLLAISRRARSVCARSDSGAGSQITRTVFLSSLILDPRRTKRLLDHPLRLVRLLAHRAVLRVRHDDDDLSLRRGVAALELEGTSAARAAAPCASSS